jgi:hypothetical protein
VIDWPVFRLLLSATPPPAPQPARDEGGWVLILVVGGFMLLSLPFAVRALLRMLNSPGRRGAALAAMARRVGLAFSPRTDLKVARRFALFEPLCRGENRQASNVLRSESGDRRVTAFDFYYQTGSGDRKQSHYLSAAVLNSPFKFKRLLIRPEGLADRIAALAGMEDIDFESHEFSKRFYVSCADRKFAYDMITPEMMALLLKHPGWTIEAKGYDVLFWKGEREFTVGEFHEAVTLATDLLNLVPEHIWRVRAAVAEEPREANQTAGPACS